MIDSIFFVLAHQDDEMGVYPIIERAIADGNMPVCIYLTSGAQNKQKKIKLREKESTSVLLKLGVSPDNIYFLGSAQNIGDGELIDSLDLAAKSLIPILESYINISNVFVHAYEGGHHDHDASFIIVAYCLHVLSLGSIGLQFPMYRSSFSSFLPYVVNQCLIENGTSKQIIYDRWNSLRYFKLTLIYRSQWKSMLGLVPFYLFFWFLQPVFKYQSVNIFRGRARPHKGELLYEKHRRFTFSKFESRATAFLASLDLDSQKH